MPTQRIPTLEYTFHALGYNQVLVGTVESFPELKTCDGKAEDRGEEESGRSCHLCLWREIMRRTIWRVMKIPGRAVWREEGYEVRAILKGLGEFEGIRKIFLEHIEEAAGQAADR